MTTFLSTRETRLLDAEIARLERLVADLKAIRDSHFPSQSILMKAPKISNWTLSKRFVPCINGLLSDHPNINDGEFGITSELILLDVDRGFARTRSRCYRLGSAAVTE